jgi:predicted permease
MADLIRDLRLAVRLLAADRAFATTAIATLGLGLALSAAALITVNAYLLSGLPYPGASRLYWVRYAEPGAVPPRDLADLEWPSLGEVIEQPIAWDLDMFYLVGGSHAEAAPGAWVTPGFMEGLGVRPAFGSGFDAAAFVPGSAQVALISHRLWQGRFAGDPRIVGRTFEAYVSDRPDEAETFTIVGVLPPGFWHLNVYTDVLTPLRIRTFPYMARLRQGRTAADAAAAIGALVRASRPGLAANWQPAIVSAHDQYVAAMRPVLRAATGAAAAVFVIGLANVAGLLLIRTTKRQKEMAVRAALGASRFAIVRLLLSEAAVLGAAATAVGLAAGAAITRWISPLIQRELGRPAPAALEIDMTVLATAAIVGSLVALACGFAPLLVVWRLGLRGSLHGSGRTATEGRGGRRARAALIALQVAGSLALLTAGTLMARSVTELLRVDFGIDARRVLSTSLTLRQRTYPDAAARAALYERLLSRLSSTPGVERVSLAAGWPLQEGQAWRVHADTSGRVTTQSAITPVTADHFDTLRITVSAGRAFTGADRAASEPVAVISETLARRVAPQGRALDARLTVLPPEGQPPAAPAVVRRVVGIVRDVRQTAGDRDFADIYVPLLQTAGRSSWLYVRTAGEPLAWMPALRDAVREIDPEITLAEGRSLQGAIEEQLSRPAFLAWLLGGFAGVAALLSLVGVYGVIAYAVRQREREIAVRAAIGASPASITRLFVRQGGLVVSCGLVAGLPLALLAGRALESQLYGVRPADPWSLGVTTLAFGLAGLAAVWWPARRAAGADPAAALKDE